MFPFGIRYSLSFNFKGRASKPVGSSTRKDVDENHQVIKYDQDSHLSVLMEDKLDLVAATNARVGC